MKSTPLDNHMDPLGRPEDLYRPPPSGQVQVDPIDGSGSIDSNPEGKKRTSSW